MRSLRSHFPSLFRLMSHYSLSSPSTFRIIFSPSSIPLHLFSLIHSPCSFLFSFPSASFHSLLSAAPRYRDTFAANSASTSETYSLYSAKPCSSRVDRWELSTGKHGSGSGRVSDAIAMELLAIVEAWDCDEIILEGMIGKIRRALSKSDGFGERLEHLQKKAHRH